MSDQEQDLLSVLEAHGKQFLRSFDVPIQGSSVKRKSAFKSDWRPAKRLKAPDSGSEGEEAEWGGIQNHKSESSGSELEDDGGTAGISPKKIVLFSENISKSIGTYSVSKSQINAFMVKTPVNYLNDPLICSCVQSSKISKLRDTNASIPQSKNRKTPEEQEDERTNSENDALLHKLVHTKLLSGSLSVNLDEKPAHRHKALAGRVMELVGGVKLGKGENTVREVEKNKAGKRVREGLTRKKKEKERQGLEEAKNLGNYHPTLKRLFEPSSVGSAPRSRTRGLKLGVGKFRAGVLRLNRQEISSVIGTLQDTSEKRGRKRK